MLVTKHIQKRRTVQRSFVPSQDVVLVVSGLREALRGVLFGRLGSVRVGEGCLQAACDTVFYESMSICSCTEV